MRARKKRGGRSTAGSWLDLIRPGLQFPRGRGVDEMLEGDPEIERETLARREAAEKASLFLRGYNRTPEERRPNIPLIAGYTDTPGGEASGYAEWLGKTPTERLMDSALGAAFQMSSQMDASERANLPAYAEKVAGKGDYWGGLAKNIMFGSPMPEARLQKVTPDFRVEGEAGGVSRPQESAEGPQQTQVFPHWSEMSRSSQEAIVKYAEEHGISVEEAIRSIAGKYRNAPRKSTVY